MLNSSFMIPMKRESESIEISRTSVSEAQKGRTRRESLVEKVDKPKGPSFQELLSQVKDNTEQKSEKKIGTEETEKKAETVFSDSVEVESKLVSKDNSENLSLKDKLIKEILIFLEQNKESLKMLRNGGDLPQGKVDLDKQSLPELKDLLDKLKTDMNALFQVKIILSELKEDKSKGSSMTKDESKAVGALSEKDSAFKVEDGKEGPRLFVNKDKVQVVDKRTSGEPQDAGVKTLTEGQKSTTGTEDSMKKDSPTLSRSEVSGFKEMMEKREVQDISAKNVAKEVRETNKVFHDVVQQSKIMIQDKKTSMQLDLKPEHLGRVTLKIEVVYSKVMATIYAQNEGTGDMLKQNMQNMQNAFKDAGLNLQGLEVNVGTSDREFKDMMGEQEKLAEKSLSNNLDVADDVYEGLSAAAASYGMVGLMSSTSVDYIV